MKRFLIIGILAAVACSGPTGPTPEGKVLFSADFESGVLPDWKYIYCAPSIENDGDNYLLLTAEEFYSSSSSFGFSRYPDKVPAGMVESFDVSFAYKTTGISYGAVYVAGGNFIGQTFEPSPEWRKVKFQPAKADWPSLFDMGLASFGSYRPGVALAVDDIKVTAVY